MTRIQEKFKQGAKKMILEIILGVSIFFNVMLVWYIYKLLKNLLDIEDQFLEMKTKLIEFATHLKGINKVESFYGDPTITALIEHMKKLSIDIEEYANTTYFKVTADNLKNYNKCSFSILSPEVQNSDSFFDGITPYNPEPSKGLETGCQFIMMNYQKIDTNMSNYTYIFKDSSFVLKSDNLTDNNNNCVRNFTSIKTQKLEHTNSEVVYTYVTPKDQIPENP